ncbi:hypothetical protein M0L20_23345 [Spirosoma sp. RP8]|uniref:Uncharacterized protein n=1 Tax=Spirosoma liriopis TaxID=2937440 RepID=A0ABT0HRM0_9BACT|nr:hypothetical protein [Spirosoma liriopis]MCK8494824.1 hypothetical protein [Spirosoma liriopis]
MENKDYSHIPGWGIDIDPKNDPTYPIKHRTDAEQKGYSWERPPQQPVDIEVLRSIERPNVSAVFGTSVPPSGLSGQIRRYAFRSSESEYGHWLPLILADRIGAVEGVIDDLKKGHIPNIFAERGWKAQWQHNRKGLVQKILIGAVITTAVVALLSRKNDSQED